MQAGIDIALLEVGGRRLVWRKGGLVLLRGIVWGSGRKEGRGGLDIPNSHPSSTPAAFEKPFKSIRAKHISIQTFKPAITLHNNPSTPISISIICALIHLHVSSQMGLICLRSTRTLDSTRAAVRRMSSAGECG